MEETVTDTSLLVQVALQVQKGDKKLRKFSHFYENFYDLIWGGVFEEADQIGFPDFRKLFFRKILSSFRAKARNVVAKNNALLFNDLDLDEDHGQIFG